LDKEKLNTDYRKWFDNTIYDLSIGISKKTDYLNIRDRINSKLERSNKFTKEYTEPINREIIFLIFWSCLNDFSFINIISWYPFLKFKNCFELKELRKKGKLKYFPYIRKIFNLVPSRLKCTIYMLIEEDCNDPIPIDPNKMSFYLQAYLQNKKCKEETLLLFNYLCQKRNQLFLIHGNERNNSHKKEIIDSLDNVTIFDCILMLKFIRFIFLEPINAEKEFVSLFNSENILHNNRNIVFGKLIKKVCISYPEYEDVYFYKFIVEYYSDQKINKIVFEVDKLKFNLFSENEFLKIEYIVNLKEGNGNYFSEVRSINIERVTKGPNT